jgi:hypothetical protein
MSYWRNRQAVKAAILCAGVSILAFLAVFGMHWAARREMEGIRELVAEAMSEESDGGGELLVEGARIVACDEVSGQIDIVVVGSEGVYGRGRSGEFFPVDGKLDCSQYDDAFPLALGNLLNSPYTVRDVMEEGFLVDIVVMERLEGGEAEMMKVRAIDLGVNVPRIETIFGRVVAYEDRTRMATVETVDGKVIAVYMGDGVILDWDEGLEVEITGRDMLAAGGVYWFELAAVEYFSPIRGEMTFEAALMRAVGERYLVGEDWEEDVVPVREARSIFTR